MKLTTGVPTDSSRMPQKAQFLGLTRKSVSHLQGMHPGYDQGPHSPSGASKDKKGTCKPMTWEQRSRASSSQPWALHSDSTDHVTQAHDLPGPRSHCHSQAGPVSAKTGKTSSPESSSFLSEPREAAGTPDATEKDLGCHHSSPTATRR